jgi:hypothetical protein
LANRILSSKFSLHNQHERFLFREASENCAMFSQRVVQSLSLSGLEAEVAAVVGNQLETRIAFALTCTLTSRDYQELSTVV